MTTSLSALVQAVRTQTKAIWSQEQGLRFYQCTLDARQLPSRALCPAVLEQDAERLPGLGDAQL